jgi:glycosyltransferase involved in cell wall biosynthesis
VGANLGVFLTTTSDQRTKLAVVGGFTRPRDDVAHGTHHAAYAACEAIAKVGGYSEIHVFHERPAPAGRRGELALPSTPACRVFDKTEMPTTAERYEAVYVANGEQIGPVPHVLRPHEDWAPVICSVGTAHSASQWQSLLLALASDSVRPSDGFIFKSKAAQALFRQVWEAWKERLTLEPAFPGGTVVIPNGVDVEANRRSAKLREEIRRSLRLHPSDVVFLGFSRLSPGSKGDQSALIVRWKEVVERTPSALLLLAGAQVDRKFTVEQRQLARMAAVADRVVILENPFELFPDARNGLMSAADVFVHLTTGVEEASPMVIREAMAHSLPVIASRWAGAPEIVTPGEDGFLIGAVAAPVPEAFNESIFGVSDRPVGLGASRSAVCDFDDLVARASALCEPQLRQGMGAAARRTAERNSAEVIARATVDFFQRTSRLAREAWPPPRRFRPLVQMDQVLAAQTARTLQPNDRVMLARTERAVLLTEGWDPEGPPQVWAALAAFERRPDIELGALAEAILGPGAPAGRRGNGSPLRSASRLIVKLLNYGVIRFATGEPPRHA